MNPDVCNLANAAIKAQEDGNGNTHPYLFFRGDASKPSKRAHVMHAYPNGNYYWGMTECPDDRKVAHSPVPWHIPADVVDAPH